MNNAYFHVKKKLEPNIGVTNYKWGKLLNSLHLNIQEAHYEPRDFV